MVEQIKITPRPGGYEGRKSGNMGTDIIVDSQIITEVLRNIETDRYNDGYHAGYNAGYNSGYNVAKKEIALSGEYERAYQRGKADAHHDINDGKLSSL